MKTWQKKTGYNTYPIGRKRTTTGSLSSSIGKVSEIRESSTICMSNGKRKMETASKNTSRKPLKKKCPDKQRER